MNETIVDLMAHTSVKTPSIAAEFIIAHNKSFEEEILNMQKAIIIKSQQLLRYRQQSLSQVVADLSNSTRDILLSNREGLNNAYQLTINKSQSIIFDGRASLNELSGRILSRPTASRWPRSPENKIWRATNFKSTHEDTCLFQRLLGLCSPHRLRFIRFSLFLGRSCGCRAFERCDPGGG